MQEFEHRGCQEFILSRARVVQSAPKPQSGNDLR
jgi:hypothetical protein